MEPQRKSGLGGKSRPPSPGDHGGLTMALISHAATTWLAKFQMQRSILGRSGG